jgi:seryl-tRNA synthetase
MHDLTFFRNNLDQIAERLASRGFVLDLDHFRKLDSERRAAVTQAEKLKERRNTASQEIARLRKEGQDTSDRQAQVRSLGDEIAGLEAAAKKSDEDFRELLTGIPNVPHESTPCRWR